MRALLSDFLDRTLHWRTSRSLEAHLVVCPPCRCFVATVEKTILLYRQRPVVDVPVAVRVHLRALLRERHESAPDNRSGRCAGAGKRVASRKRATGQSSSAS
jgi:predicted anti-sigma-YlaC factor YlaD